MTKLEEVLAEEWDTEKVALSMYYQSGRGYPFRQDDDLAEVRDGVAVLGKRALSWMLACHACDRCILRVCPDHTTEFDAIVAEARSIG